MSIRGLLRSDRYVRNAAVFALLSVLVICFIFSQSLLSKEESGDLSAGILQWLLLILDPNGIFPEGTLHHYLRKAAHFTEFAAFGCFFNSFAWNLGRYLNRKFVSLPLFAGLLVAVCDEFLQYFTGRGSMVTDVVIDFSGALCGTIFVFLIANTFIRKKLPQ